MEIDQWNIDTLTYHLEYFVTYDFRLVTAFCLTKAHTCNQPWWNIVQLRNTLTAVSGHGFSLSLNWQPLNDNAFHCFPKKPVCCLILEYQQTAGPQSECEELWWRRCRVSFWRQMMIILNKSKYLIANVVSLYMYSAYTELHAGYSK